MKNLSWDATVKRNCEGKFAASLKIKYKGTACKVPVADIYKEGVEDEFEEQFYKTLKGVFGKKKGKKIAKQVIEEVSTL